MSNIKKVNRVDVNGTSLQGRIHTSFDDLADCFGEPTSDGDGYKIDVEWEIQFVDGTVATIYNWKNGKNYCGDEGDDSTDITDWHIGAHNLKAVEQVHAAMDAHLKATCYQAPAQLEGA